jgi:hypothetical protein
MVIASAAEPGAADHHEQLSRATMPAAAAAGVHASVLISVLWSRAKLRNS